MTKQENPQLQILESHSQHHQVPLATSAEVAEILSASPLLGWTQVVQRRSAATGENRLTEGAHS